MAKINLLVNLPTGFYRAAILNGTFRRLSKMARLRKRSHNTAAEIEKDLGWADAVIMWSWPALDHALLDKAPKLKFSGQLDIGQAAARVALDRKLAVSVAKRGWSPAVAEMALGLTLSTLRKIAGHQAAMRAGTETWVRKFPDDIDADERQLTGRSVGIIGFGGVGRRFAELLAPFHCDIRIHDPYLPDGVEKRFGARRVPLTDLLRHSDVVVLSAANNPGTRHMLGARQIAAFRRGAVFVNVARAAIVDTKALIERLKKRDLYAALDVFDKEPLEKDAALRKLPNAFLTPHRAGGILESVERIMNQLAGDLEAHFAGRDRSCPLTEAMVPGLDG